jgi:hypothetical protein
MIRVRLELAIVDSVRYKIPDLRGHTVFTFENMSATTPGANINSHIEYPRRLQMPSSELPQKYFARSLGHLGHKEVLERR